jgi:iron complex outermembrane receptor protein
MRFQGETLSEYYREDKYLAKVLLKWQANEQHKIAVGAEYLHGEYGFPAIGFPGELNARDSRLNPMPRWGTNLYSFLAEWQWNINDKWTTFAGARLDKHTFTKLMTSPRAAVVFSPTDIDTLKLMWSRSVRSNFEEEMKAQDINNGLASKPETLDSAEFRYERQQTKNLDLAASVFLHYNLEIISYDQIAGHSVPLGTQREWGVELEASYHTDKTRLTVSHAYTKLIDFDLAKGKDTYISAKPYGVGDDLANWSNHLSKLTLQQKLDDKWTLNSSLRVYWGFPGLKDINKYWAGNSDPTMPTPDFPSLKPGYNEPFEGSYFLDLGLQYKASKDLLIGVTGYNLLGLFDKNLNKRNFLGASDFRDEAVAIGVSVEYKF